MVLTFLKELDINKTTGSDGIPVRLLKVTADQIVPSLTILFNKSLWLGIFPGDWKLANIVPIFKKGKRNFVANHRAISLLPVISKVLERCVLAGLRHHMSHLISREQHGFLAGRSCLTRLTSVLHYIGGQLDAGKQIDIIYLDMSKAFDKVDHTKLLGRLHQYGITGKLHDWFRSYLQERKQQVTVLGATSRELPVTSGVPQGSLLGPILFLLFVDDLPNTVKTSRVACYADDTKIFKSIDSITDCNALQSDLNDLVSWSESSGLIFNQSKCKYQCITRKTSPVQPTYNINETPLESCDTEKDLGVWVSSNLTSDKQVTEQCAKANKLLGFVRQDSRYIQSTQTRRTLYLSIVRCHLGYATQVWSPQSIGLLKRVENVQRRATKLILKLPFRCDVTYKTRLQLTNLLPISCWHEVLDMVFFYTAVNNVVFIDSEALPTTKQSRRSTRSSSSNAITYIPKRSRTVTYQRSFSIRACSTWNVLPTELRTSHTSLASFKRSLFQCYNKALDLYDLDDIRAWRTICPKCNIARTLLCPPTCFF